MSSHEADGFFLLAGRRICSERHRRMSKRRVPVLVCFAVPEEAKPFKRLVQGSDDVAVTVVGMGAGNAETSFKRALEVWDPERVVTSGFAGGLNPKLRKGDVIYEMDEGFGSSQQWRDSGGKPGRFHCSDRVAVSSEEKSKLRQETGADAVEMESGVIRRICLERAIRSATVRVVSDAADEHLPLDFNSLMKPDMSLDFGKLAWTLMKSPGKIPVLLRFQGQVNRAAVNLAEILTKGLGLSATA